MSMKEDIISILVEYRDKIHEGNTDRAAKALGVNVPTLWRWLNGKNTPKVQSLSTAFDTLDARIVLPGKEELSPNVRDYEMELLKKDVASLTEQNELLRELLRKYKEVEEAQTLEKNEDSQKEGRTRRPTPTADTGVDYPA